jgi:hypothetical protein
MLRQPDLVPLLELDMAFQSMEPLTGVLDVVTVVFVARSEGRVATGRSRLGPARVDESIDGLDIPVSVSEGSREEASETDSTMVTMLLAKTKMRAMILMRRRMLRAIQRIPEGRFLGVNGASGEVVMLVLLLGGAYGRETR